MCRRPRRRIPRTGPQPLCPPSRSPPPASKSPPSSADVLLQLLVGLLRNATRLRVGDLLSGRPRPGPQPAHERQNPDHGDESGERRNHRAPRLWTSHSTQAPVSASALPVLADRHARQSLVTSARGLSRETKLSEAPNIPACTHGTHAIVAPMASSHGTHGNMSPCSARRVASQLKSPARSARGRKHEMLKAFLPLASTALAEGHARQTFAGTVWGTHPSRSARGLTREMLNVAHTGQPWPWTNHSTRAPASASPELADGRARPLCWCSSPAESTRGRTREMFQGSFRCTFPVPRALAGRHARCSTAIPRWRRPSCEEHSPPARLATFRNGKPSS